MILMSQFVELIDDMRIDELIDILVNDDFPLEIYPIEEAQDVREIRDRILVSLREMRKDTEIYFNVDPEDELFHIYKEGIELVKGYFYQLLALYADAQLRCALGCLGFVVRLDYRIARFDKAMEKAERGLRRAKTRMRLKQRNITIEQNNKRRDALLFELARESGLQSVKKQADYIAENWDDTELAEFKPLSADRIRKILGFWRDSNIR